MKSIAKNKKATFDYLIEETYEAGLVLSGSEVKSLRQGHGSVVESYAIIRNNEAWLLNSYIPPFKQASVFNHVERRERKLLLKAKEIKTLEIATRQKGYTLVPLELYWNKENRVKIKIGLAKGKANYDKRADLKKKDAQRDIQRAMRQ